MDFDEFLFGDKNEGKNPSPAAKGLADKVEKREENIGTSTDVESEILKSINIINTSVPPSVGQNSAAGTVSVAKPAVVTAAAAKPVVATVTPTAKPVVTAATATATAAKPVAVAAVATTAKPVAVAAVTTANPAVTAATATATATAAAKPVVATTTTPVVESSGTTKNNANIVHTSIEDEILKNLENMPQTVEEEPKKFTMAELAEMNKTDVEAADKAVDKAVDKAAEENEQQQEDEESSDSDDDEKVIIEKKRREILSKIVEMDESAKKEESIDGSVKEIKEIDLKGIDYSAFDAINEEHIDLYYILNDSKNNPEFLDEDLMAQSKKEEEARAMKKQEKDELNFDLEELVVEDEIKIDLSDILSQLDDEK
ncbi:MAG: hypothetical protein LBS34_02365 [Rickettsiales bacterium]|jgi:hypothetical protein|nr:hypothetical protein [Rickettsiales bacterium]